MVSVLTLVCLTLATLLIAALPFWLYRKMRPQYGFGRRDVIVGIAVFALFSMVIERGLHGLMLSNATTVGLLMNPALFVIYGALATGICEEVGRFAGMKWLIRRDPASLQKPGTALGYGIGHGGAEAWLVGVLVQLQWLLYATLADRNMLDQYFTSVPAESLLRLHMVLGSLTPESAGLFLAERAAAFVFQIGFSVVMWHMLRERFRFTLPFMIVAHALIALPIALYQARLIPLLAADAVYLVFGLIVMRALRRYFIGVRVASDRAARAKNGV
ncbi:YhfC family intramembrane metalloprotease [Burkholderia sp. PAMC 26561]|uniref:YhfC family intramembrane metalloprotease n=1 Tax=Burkholderia sp. PAMC 26561 TaxID=1795043 RepID=UPI00076B8A8C|nr:YhfC family intramembrane metalloprotease [Burkholderia sp. PAMC 26561]AME24781.1 hypothetical protein AXG89_13860 [Burkholderia sp. PAMC 26561]